MRSCSILYQRAIYPPEQFEHVRKYGMNMLVTSDAQLREYLDKVMEQIKQWLVGGDLQRLVLVITNARTEEVTERWQFEVETETELGLDGSVQKSEKQINSEIAAIIRQITASVTFLPLITDPCTFDLLVYTAAEANVPSSWEESDPRYVNNSEEMRMRSFATKVHRVGTSVSYAKTVPEEA